MKKEIAIFAAGCFWGVQDDFDSIPGVLSTIVGYTGGTKDKPTYREVCSGETGHAEAVKLEYDSEIVSYKQLLDSFWNMHDPTQLNQQGPDIGSQYRSAIFYTSDKQKKEAEKSLNEHQKKMKKRIVTEITAAGKFWPAEDYHQHYNKKHGR